jgi:sugar lactone lactonase YvrE
LDRFASSGIRVPNYPVVDEERGFLYVSDSVGDPGPGIYRYDLATGDGGIWCPGPTRWANGMAMAPDRGSLYFVESNVPCVSRVAILTDGSAGPVTRLVSGVDNVPDGLAFAPDGSLFICCYEPSRIYWMRKEGHLELLIEDPKATVLAHPTNIALKRNKMYTANLGRWHITEIDLSGIGIGD